MLTRSGKELKVTNPIIPSLPLPSSVPATPSSSKPTTRTSTNFWLIGQPCSSITGAKLPTRRQVMKYVLYLRHDPDSVGNSVKNEEISYIVADSVADFWHMARIKTKVRQNCMFDVLGLWNEWTSLKKNRSRATDPGNKRENFISELDMLFDIGAPDAIDDIRKSRLLSQKHKDDDIAFYLDQKHERKSSMNGQDKIFEAKALQFLTRIEQQQQRQEKETERLEKRAAAELEGNEFFEESEDDAQVGCTEIDPDFEPDHIIEKIEFQEFVTLQVPRKIMECDELTTAADRLKLSDNQTTMIVSAIIKAAGGNLDDFDVSRSTTRRKRMSNRQHIAENIMEKIKEKPPQFGAMHWDGKLLQDSLGDKFERLAILLSGSPEFSSGKLLGVPQLGDSKGQTQADASYDLLEAWGLKESVVALVFDTTASNSGVHKGAAKLIEELVDKKLFYLACRHHILELVASAVWKSLFGEIRGPENKMFATFKEAWSGLDKQSPIQLLKIENPWLLEVKERVIENLKMLLNSKESSVFPRDDYRECAENNLIVLGETPPRGTHFLKPGAIHQARWMACNIYAGKMFMFSKAMKYDKETVIKLERINRFLALFYTSAWMQASIGADAPVNDLELIHDMMDFRNVDREIADVVVAKLNNHRWYLTEEVVPFALFSHHPKMSDHVKQEIANKLWTIAVPENFRMGKPIFRQIKRNTTLKSLLGPESHLLFQNLNIRRDWLAKPVNQWAADEDFQVAEKFVRTVKVVNDAAERGVKLISDFATIITTDEQQRAWLLQGVEQHRKLFPSFDKKTLNI